jgi:hypothetical protein
MTRRYLFGPVTSRFAEQNLHEACQAGNCLAFNADGSAGLAISWDDSWQAIAARWPEDRFPGRPQPARLDKLVVGDEARLQCEHAEQQTAPRLFVFKNVAQ